MLCGFFLHQHAITDRLLRVFKKYLRLYITFNPSSRIILTCKFTLFEIYTRNICVSFLINPHKFLIHVITEVIFYENRHFKQAL